MVQDHFEDGKKYSLKSFCKILLSVSMECVKGLTKFKCFVFKDGSSKALSHDGNREKKQNHSPGGGKRNTQSNGENQGSSKTKRPSDSSSTNRASSPAKKQLTACAGCGHAFHAWNACLYKDHPDFNKDSSVAWADSEPGQAWAKRGIYKLPDRDTLAAAGGFQAARRYDPIK